MLSCVCEYVYHVPPCIWRGVYLTCHMMHSHDPLLQLREKGVSYLNKLAKFVDPHTVELSDKKGAKVSLRDDPWTIRVSSSIALCCDCYTCISPYAEQTITGARIVVAVGGRPQPLSCPGGELAITSDDLFTLVRDTLCSD